MTGTCVAQIVRLACALHISCVIFMRSCCVFDSLRLLHLPLFAVYLLSCHPVFPLGHQFHLPRCGGQIPCALQLMRTLALLPSTTHSQFAKWFTRSICTRSKIILGTATRCGEILGNPTQHCWPTEYLVHRSQRWNCRMHGGKITSLSWSRCWRNIGIRNHSSKTWVKGRRSSSARNHNKLLVDMDQTEIFELDENSAKLQCPDCDAFTEIGVICFSCGRIEVFAESYNTTEDQLRLYFNPWLCHWEEFQSRTKARCILKDIMFFKATEMLKKASQSSKLRLLCRSQNWMPDDREQLRNPQAASSSSTS